MSNNSPPPPKPERAHLTHHLGTSASYLILSILTANQTAARPFTSVPYLVQGAPVALRISPNRVPIPPPPPLVILAAGTDQDVPDFDPTHLPQEQPLLAPPTPAVLDPKDAQSKPISTPDIPPGAPGSVPLIPDRFQRPTPVRVEDLLPFLLPAPRPVSRATYELK